VIWWPSMGYLYSTPMYTPNSHSNSATFGISSTIQWDSFLSRCQEGRHEEESWPRRGGEKENHHGPPVLENMASWEFSPSPFLDVTSSHENGKTHGDPLDHRIPLEFHETYSEYSFQCTITILYIHMYSLNIELCEP
jgi:hypothetical protein